MRSRLLLLAAVSIVFLGCVTPKVTQHSIEQVDFARFHTATYRVHDTPTTEYGSDANYAKETMALFDTLVGEKLTALGYTAPPAGSSPDLTIDVAVSALKEGSGAARFWVGFGAGRAIFLFDASFIDSAGKKVASFEGGRSYTGMEFGHAFAGKDDIRIMAATRGVSQIEQFMRNGGSFEPHNGGKPTDGSQLANTGPIVYHSQEGAPVSALPALSGKSVQNQLAELKELHDKGLISDDVYGERQRALLAAHPL